MHVPMQTAHDTPAQAGLYISSHKIISHKVSGFSNLTPQILSLSKYSFGHKPEANAKIPSYAAFFMKFGGNYPK